MINLILNRNFELPEDDWYQLAPLGEFPHNGAGITQLIDADACTRMVTAFENARGQTENFPGLLIDFDHFSLDEQITIAATGGLLTMLTEAGSGTLAGGAHQDTFLQIAKSDAVTLAGVLQNAIDVPLLEQHFPGQPIQAYFKFSPNLTQETRQVVQDALLLKAAGLEVKAEEISEKTGYSLAAL